MQVKRASLGLVTVGVLLGSACGLYRKAMYKFPIKGTERTLVAYRIPTGPLSRTLELRLESTDRSVLLHSLSGDWSSISCVAVALSPEAKRISYLVTVWGAERYIGSYDLSEEEPRQVSDADLELLRAEIRSRYHGHRDFPANGSGDLIDWAQDSNRCQIAFHDQYGYGED